MPDSGRDAIDDDPRRGDDGLGWVSRALFGDVHVRVSTHRPGRTADEPAEGWHRVGEFTVVPDVAHARFLLPTDSRRVTAASLLAYNALRSPGTRAARWVLGRLSGAGLAPLRLLPRLTVDIPSDMDSAAGYVVRYLSDRLGVPDLHAAIGVRPPDPHHKPTVQLFDGRGRAAGYAKVGWNDATRQLVRAEITTLAGLPATDSYPLVPRVLHAADWAGRTIAVIDPLPAGVRRVPRAEWPYPQQLLAIARRGGGSGPVRPLAGSGYLADLVDQASAADCRPADRAVAAAAALAERYGPIGLEFGDWHGDWVPWNLGTHRGQLVVWDWEHHRADVPVGLDLAHHGFQRALTLDSRPAADATDAAADALAVHGPALGLDANRQRVVLDCYLLELWLRTWRLADGGAGWNRLLHPHLLDLLDHRLGAAA